MNLTNLGNFLGFTRKNNGTLRIETIAEMLVLLNKNPGLARIPLAEKLGITPASMGVRLNKFEQLGLSKRVSGWSPKGYFVDGWALSPKGQRALVECRGFTPPNKPAKPKVAAFGSEMAAPLKVESVETIAPILPALLLAVGASARPKCRPDAIAGFTKPDALRRTTAKVLDVLYTKQAFSAVELAQELPNITLNKIQRTLDRALKRGLVKPIKYKSSRGIQGVRYEIKHEFTNQTRCPTVAHGGTYGCIKTLKCDGGCYVAETCGFN